MTKDEIKKLAADLLEIDESELSDDGLFEEAGLDSVRFIQLIVEIENKYDIEVYDSDLDMDNFRSADAAYATLAKYFEANADKSNDEAKLIKCVITDCDGVMWRGIAGEGGIDAAYPDGDTNAYVEMLSEMKKRGVLLAAVSRNERGNIADMFKRGDILVNEDDFIAVITDCSDKAAAIGRILAETGFYAENVLYIDDSAYELAVVGDAADGLNLLCADPFDALMDELRNYLRALPDAADVDRTAQFREQKAREAVHITARSVDEYNEILETTTVCRIADESDASRIAELSQRANRFNTSGARYSEDEVRAIISDGDMSVYIISAADKFGDMGIVGAAAVRGNVIESFLLSCRVFGRDFEKILLGKITEDCTDGRKKHLRGIWNDTGKNGYCRDFFRSCGITSED